MRVGAGLDAHRFERGRRLVLGGVVIPSEEGLAGHSDADVLLHALMDALLGACGEGDIGEMFPDSDPSSEGASSADLLGEVAQVVRDSGFRIVNADMTVVCERPRIAPYRDVIRGRVAELLGCSAGAVGVKGTTTEGMGFTGRGEGIMALAVVLLEETGA